MIKAQAIEKQLQNADGTYKGTFGNVWHGGIEGCKRLTDETEKEKCLKNANKDTCAENDMKGIMKDVKNKVKETDCILRQKTYDWLKVRVIKHKIEF